jgi:hypothetical protein
MHKLVLRRADKLSLLDVIERRRFFDLPRDMRSGGADGSSVYVLCADAHREHWVHSYHSENTDFLAFHKVFMETISAAVAGAESLPASEFVEGIAAEVHSLPTGSALRNTAATWLDCVVRAKRSAFWGIDDTTRFTLPGVRARLPGAVEFEEVKPLKAGTASDHNNAAEAPAAAGGPVLDPDPIVVDFPVLDR